MNAAEKEDVKLAMDETDKHEEGLRKSTRKRTLTEKAQQNKVDDLTIQFWKLHKRYAGNTNEDETTLQKICSKSSLLQMKARLRKEFQSIEDVYYELRDVSITIDTDIRTGMDRLKADRDLIIDAIRLQLYDGESAHHSMRSRSSHHSSRCRSSHHSGSTTSKMREAAANAAAHRAELEARKDEALKEQELQQLELEETKRRAQAEVTLQAKRRELEQQRILKLLSMEEAKVQVYKEEIDHDIPTKLFVKKPNSEDLTYSTAPQQSRQSGSDYVAIAEAFAEAVSLSRLPAPEPSVFDGDPLKYNDWSISFKALIEDKKISQADKIHYLKRYLCGEAREAVSGYFLLTTDTAFEQAKKLLEERYGNQFVVTEAFRDKLEAWPRIHGRDGTSLRRFSDFLNQCKAAMLAMKGLEILNDNRENRKLLQKLPDWVVNRWARIASESKMTSGKYPSFSKFAEFITLEANIACDPITSLESLRCTSEKEKSSKIEKKKEAVGRKTLTTDIQVKEIVKVTDSCINCKRNGHILAECRTFAAKSATERENFVKENGLCFACLCQGHMSKKCPERSICKKCKKKHPTSLHREQNPFSDHNFKKDKDASEKVCEKIDVKEATCGNISQVGTETMSSMIVPVWVSTKENPSKECLVYALLDTQSDTTFILEETASKLDARSEPVRLRLSTMSTRNSVITSQRFQGLKVRGYNMDITISLPTTYSRDFIPTDRSHIPTSDTANMWPHLREIAQQIPPLQDCEIGLLIGYNCPVALAPRSYITGQGNKPFAIKTDIGWSIVGGIDSRIDGGDAIGLAHRVVVREIPKDLQLNVSEVDKSEEFDCVEVRFVYKTRIKEVIAPNDILNALESDFDSIQGKDCSMSQDDFLFLDKIGKSIHQQKDGFYTMPLPFKERPNLPNNRAVALHRFNHLRRRFTKDEKYFQDYDRFMNDIIDRGDCERIPSEELNGEVAWYIPHHGVYHPKKPDKVRVVFDCSAKYQGRSLNDCLLQGPDLTNGLVGVLLRFRQEPVAIMCDIEKMFHQFKVEKEDQDYLRFLWLDGDANVIDYRMKVHLFGATSSPGCANYGLKQIANDNEQDSLEAAKFIRDNFYVDDGLKSIDTPANAKQLVSETREMCAKGNLRLHKFVSNCPEVLEVIPCSEQAREVTDLDLFFEEPKIERALGIQWCIKSDSFQFRLTLKDQPLTRRGILSTVASVYDPMGFVAPFVLLGKHILQQMCRDQLNWDEPIPEELRARWERWREDLLNLVGINVQRCFRPKEFGKVKTCELHHFSDASTTGYGQCSYLRLVDDMNQVHCSLVLGKAKVTPMKVVTIPRLELQAAVVSVRASNLLRQELEYEQTSEYFWTDSKVVLGYIGNEAKRFHVYVANRVQRIRDSTQPNQWHYVTTEENPADHASRGLGAKELKSSNWFTGPSFLWEKDIDRDDACTELSSDDPEVKVGLVHRVKSVEDSPVVSRLEHFSDWSRAVRGIARLKLFLSNRLNINNEQKTNLTSEEDRQRAEKMIIECLQRDAFMEEMNQLKHGTELKEDSKLIKLDPFIDEDGILRVGGRLKHTISLDYDSRHPVILPQRTHLTSLIVKYCHEKVAHQGRGITINEVRSNGFWIIGISSMVSSLIHYCVECKKLRGRTQEQKMANLPEERLEPAPPFTYCGFDCFGPFTVKDGRKECKRYGLLFTCMASRAVHIEILYDMTTDSFINALRCFIALRGSVRQLRSDQGTNFIGARNELRKAFREIDEEKVRSFLATHKCDFVFNVPNASHMGGVWERQIRTIRSVLAAILSKMDSRLDSSSLRTFLYEAMAIVNSRPLTVENLNDPCGPQPLTPNHLLTMKAGVVMPLPGKFEPEDVYAKKRWRRVQYLADQFWSRWRSEYLASLQIRQKWTKERRNIKVGDIVLMKEEDLVRTYWKMAKVIEVTSSKDDLVRQVKLLVADSSLDRQGKRTKKATYLDRPIHKLMLLIANDHSFEA